MQSGSLRGLSHTEHDYDVFSFEAGSVHLESDLEGANVLFMYIIKNDPYGLRLCKTFTQVRSAPSEDISQPIQCPVEEARISVKGCSEGNLDVLKAGIFWTRSQISIWGITEHPSHICLQSDTHLQPPKY